MLNDIEIRQLVKEKQMIGNFVDYCDQVNDKKVMSYGLTSSGYDVRLGREVKINMQSPIIADPKNNKTIQWSEPLPIKENVKGQFVIIPPQTRCLGVAIETFKMPNNIVGKVSNKSSLARCGLDIPQTTGLDIPQTTIQAGFEGSLTLEFNNTLKQPLILYINEGICHIEFIKINKPEKPYNGKYQLQSGLTHNL